MQIISVILLQGERFVWCVNAVTHVSVVCAKTVLHYSAHTHTRVSARQWDLRLLPRVLMVGGGEGE